MEVHIMSEISLKPLGREEIHKLESALLVGTLFRPEVIQFLSDPSERITWVDSLAVAAAALAREKANMTVPQIAEELGRSEATIRNHLAGKTRAGQLVRETYEKFSKEGVQINISGISTEAEDLRRRLEEESKKVEELRGKLEKIKDALRSLLSEIG
jgi:probable regulatory domain-containing protein